MSSKGPYRSKFEEGIAEVLLPEGFSYEPFTVDYWTPGTYTPDFVLGSVLVECKGWFRPGDQRKYLMVKEALKGSQELVFLLQYPLKRVRKGAKLTMSGWCERENIRWFDTPEGVAAYANSK